MDAVFLVFLVIILTSVGYQVYRKKVIASRENYINTYKFPITISQKVMARYPHLAKKDVSLVLDGLREYFHMCNVANKKMVSMPSQAVDLAWHEFILFTKKYDAFCAGAFGRFLHHTPAEGMTSPTQAQKGIKTAWRIACFRENMPAKSANRLPLLFAIDKTLKIPDGFMYSLNCNPNGNKEYCGSHIGCGSGCAGGGDGGDASSCGGCGGD